MADYWKSNDRKYCEYCKCWLSDNKASIGFHESGKRHKLNVAKRITDISRNSAKAEQERKKMDSDIRKMEEAAMQAYARDIHSSSDMTARTINAVRDAQAGRVETSVSYEAAAPSGSRKRQIDPLRLPGNSDDEDEGGRVGIKKVDPEAVPNASLWVEGKNDDGYSYYWNVKTNESVWEPPKEGFLSYAEYQRINDLALQQQQVQEAVEAKKFREGANEMVAKYNRERLKQFRRPETAAEKEAKRLEKQEKKAFKTQEEAAAPTIGSWQVVQQKPPTPPLELDLPQVTHHYVPPVVSDPIPEPPERRFKEKTIVKLEDADALGVPTTFKKRKFAAKNNARQRLDVDD